MKFGENLYNLRKKQKMSQEKLAEKVGVSRQSVSKWENGTAYPEMNRILELCKIFHCQLNDLVNDKILDFDSLDEEIKMNVVKFNKEKQKKLKIASKTISICSRVLQIVTIIASIILFIVMFFVPTIVNQTTINDKNIVILNKSIELNEITTNTITNVFSEHSKLEIILYAETIMICLIISVMIISFAMLYILIIVCIYYVFDYGHQIQLDSKGKIYGEVENNE